MSILNSIDGGGMFFGEYDRGLDPQCRVSLPSDWRSGATEFVMVPTVRSSYLLLPVGMFKKFFDAVSEQAVADVDLQEAFAFIGSQSRFCRCDKQGRMALDRSKLEEIGVTTEVRLSGAVAYIKLSAPGESTGCADDESKQRYLEALARAKNNPASSLGSLMLKGGGNE